MKWLNSSSMVATISLLYSIAAAAQLSGYNPATNQGVLDQVISAFANRASAWQAVVMNAATWLFWTLGTISLVWTFGFMALRKADIAEFFAEFIRFLLFFGFMLWLLRNGPKFAESIIRSLQQVGDKAAGTPGLSPSGIVDVGFMIWKQAIANLSVWSPVDSFIGIILSVAILLLLTVIAVNMLLLFVSGWILMYAGIFFLGFGGSRWTSDMAVNYYKTVLGVAIQLFTMILIVAIGTDLLSTFYAKMSKGTLNFEELGVMLVACVALLLLVSKAPPLLAGIISGGGSGSGIGNFGVGAIAGFAMGATGAAAATASMAGAAATGAAANVAGGVSAIKAAYSAAQESMGGGAQMFSNSGDMSQSPGNTSSSLGAAIGTGARFAAEMGSHLTKGAASVARETGGQTADGFKDRVSDTMGGKIAAAIRESAEATREGPFRGNSLSGANETEVDRVAEVAAFQENKT